MGSLSGGVAPSSGGESEFALAEQSRVVPATSATVRATVAQAIVEFFQSQYLEQFDGSYKPMIYGYWGIFGHGNVCGYGQALEEKEEQVPYFRGQNEQGMALAAMAFAKQSQNRQACAVTTSIGPGATNMVTAAACAHTNRIPLLLLPGDVFASRLPNPVLQQLEDVKAQYSVNDCFLPVSVFFDRIFRAEQLLDALPKAAQALADPQRPGPVVLSVCQDLQAEAYDFPAHLFQRRNHRLRRSPPDGSELEGLKKALLEAKRPLFLLGGGVVYSGAKESITRFCQQSGIPCTETQAGKGCVPDDLCLGGLGVTGTYAANKALENADLLVAWGSRLGDFVTSSNAGVPPTCKRVCVNLLPFDATKISAAPVVGDIKIVLDQLLQEPSLGQLAVSPEYKKEMQALRTNWLDMRSKICAQPTSDSMVVDAVNQVCHAINGVAVAAAGGLPGEMHKLWRSNGREDYHLEYGYSCMGYEVAGGVGVKMASPEKEVFSMCGDGSWLMMHTEIVSARLLKFPISVICVDNSGFGCIHRLQNGSGIREYGNLQTSGVDFVKNAEALGVEICVKTTPPDLKATLMKHCTPENRGKCKLFLVNTDPDISSPGYSWWDVAIPEHSKLSKSDQTISEKRVEYERRIAARKSAKL
ncbi:unnamed protein product [Amoebophrya sp. A120]|nr:unnamed protein product [Amoebophrya sp. A120]|eukprot:GSA120T00001581001.1